MIKAAQRRRRRRKFPYTIAASGERMLEEWIGDPFEGLRMMQPPLLRCRFWEHLGTTGQAISLEKRGSRFSAEGASGKIEVRYFAVKRAGRYQNAPIHD